MTPYAEQAEQARARLDDLRVLSEGSTLASARIKPQEKIIELLDTLARVEALRTIGIEDVPEWARKHSPITTYMSGYGHCLDDLLKALEGEDNDTTS